MEPFDYFDELSSRAHLFLEELVEPEANTLKVRVVEGKTSTAAVPIEVAGQSLGEGLPVEVDDTCARYELNWSSYVLYQVTNESFGKKEESPERILGNLACVYRSSRLLDYVARSTNASDDYPGKLAHYQIICSDHVIDVISTEPPECIKMGSKLQVN